MSVKSGFSTAIGFFLGWALMIFVSGTLLLLSCYAMIGGCSHPPTPTKATR